MTSPYRESAEPPREVPMKHPGWGKPLAFGLAAVLGGGLAVDGCAATAWHGFFGAVVVASGALAITGAIIAIDRAVQADNRRVAAEKAAADK